MQNMFEKAAEAGQTYIHSAITTRADKYRFLALTYLAHREGQQDRQEFDKRLTSRLHREPTEPERKRPFLRLLHALLDETIAPLQYRPEFTKQTNALERIDEEFEHTATVTLDVVIEFLTDNGGVSGLYRRSREDHSLESLENETDTVTLYPIPIDKAADAGTAVKIRGQRKVGKPTAPQSRATAGANRNPGQGASQSQDPQDEPIVIQIPSLGAWVIKDRQNIRLRMPAFAPGEHYVCITVGEDGDVEAIISEKQSYQEAA